MDSNPASAPGLISSLEAMIQASVTSFLDRQLGPTADTLDAQVQAAVAAALDKRLGPAVGSLGSRITSFVGQRLREAVNTLNHHVNTSVAAALEQRLGPNGGALTAQITFNHSSYLYIAFCTSGKSSSIGRDNCDEVDRFLHKHSRLWDDAMRAKFQGVGKPWGRQEFDRLTSNFDCTLDVPCCFFVEDLCEAYPEAKVILNTHDVDDWFNSMQQTLFRIFRWPSWKLLRHADPGLCGAWCDHNDKLWSHFCDLDYDDKDKCKRRFLQHNEHVRQVVSGKRLLEYDIKQGWKPITAFLGLPDFTGTVEKNSAYGIVQMHKKLWRWVMINTAKKLGKTSLILSAGVGILAYSISRSA